ncbi:YrdB family protein (plasmid) [Deinococcus sp. KNUC1210]|uniref:YrdB family protein n=1 Tax=Deinococcus sp. KNUC1210 TaxID=2917691 RepID=UPI001EF018AF|nr:YrdB family protein [Deinococcus sp. KNUC1210]ULH13999.1 YrdB family protein [Deinococcus sp. KNUC1210]
MNPLAPVAFLTELAALVALGVWGARTGHGSWSWVLAVAAPLVFATIWGALLSPRAPVALPFAVTLTLKILVFGVATWAAVIVWDRWAAVFGVAVLLSLLADLLPT